MQLIQAVKRSGGPSTRTRGETMNASTGGNEFGFELEVEVEAEMTLAESSLPAEAAGLPASEWLFDPTDVEREEVGLRNLLEAVEGLDGDSQPGETGRR